MSFDLDKMQAVAELGEVIRLHNEALEQLVGFRKARPNMMMPNLAKMVEENLKENVQVLYKELNNLHKPPAQQTRYICKECQMAFVVPLPGGICDECRARTGSSQPRAYIPHVAKPDEDIEDELSGAEKSLAEVNSTSVDDASPEEAPEEKSNLADTSAEAEETSEANQPTDSEPAGEVDDIAKAYASALASDEEAGSDAPDSQVELEDETAEISENNLATIDTDESLNEKPESAELDIEAAPPEEPTESADERQLRDKHES